MHWLAGFWTAVWPNLAANVIWLAPTLPILLWRIRRHLHEHHGHLATVLREEIARVVGEPDEDKPVGG